MNIGKLLWDSIIYVKELVRFSVVLLIAAGMLLAVQAISVDPEHATGWVMTEMLGLSSAMVHAGVWYYVVSRCLLHIRTHEIRQLNGDTVGAWLEWQRWLMVSSALVFGLGSIQ